MVSAVILAKDSEDTLRRCIRSVNWVDEIVVVDDFSVDKTVDQIRQISQIRKNIKIYHRRLGDDFSAQRNFGLEKAKGEWILFIDRDEEVSEELRIEIQAKTQNRAIAKNCDGYYIKRQDNFLGLWLKHGETAHVKLLRLGRKRKGKWVRKVHEYWDISGPTALLSNPLLHYPHPTIRDFLRDINSYSTIHAQIAYDEGKRTNNILIVAKPLGKFLKNYIFLLGFLDGIPGLIMALMMSMHSFLSQSKLWQLQQKQISS